MLSNAKLSPVGTTKKVSLCVLVMLGILTGCDSSTKVETPVFTQLNELVTADYACKKALIALGNDLILDKPHFLQMEQVAVTSDEVTDVHEPQDLSSHDVMSLSGVLEYKDRPAHVRFDAFSTEGGQCVVSYQLDYQLDTSCIAAREEAFKKWNQIGTLGDTTRYFEHMRDPHKKAFLTNVNQNLQCLVSVRANQLITTDE